MIFRDRTMSRGVLCQFFIITVLLKLAYQKVLYPQVIYYRCGYKNIQYYLMVNSFTHARLCFQPGIFAFNLKKSRKFFCKFCIFNILTVIVAKGEQRSHRPKGGENVKPNNHEQSKQHAFDSINQQIVFNNMQPPLEYGEILYFCEWPSSKFLVKEPYLSVIGAKYFSIKFNTLYNSGHYFNEFPLKIKKGKLIPISNEAQQKCWINNNYYFPVMKKSKKEKSYYTVAQYRQDMGLQKTNCFRKKPLIIKRNED